MISEVRPGGLGVAGELLASRSQLTNPNGFERLANVTPRKFRLSNLSAIFLPRQWGLCPRVLVGASRRVRREPSLGDSSPAGAENSQATLYLHSADSELKASAEAKVPCLCCVR